MASELATLHTYTSLLPQQAAQAFALLTQAEQGRSGGQAGFVQTWQGVQAIQAGKPVPHGKTAILVRIKVNPDKGKTTDDVYQFTFVAQNGNTLIDNVTVVNKRHG